RADRLSGQCGALRQLLLAQSRSFAVPSELSPEIVGALARAHRRDIVPARLVAARSVGEVWESPRLAPRPRSTRLSPSPLGGHPSVGSDVGLASVAGNPGRPLDKHL